MGHVRETSRLAYEAICDSGEITGRRLEALRCVYAYGPATAHEMFRAPGELGLWKRLSELRDRGMIWESGQRRCRITGRVAIVWASTGRVKPLGVEDDASKPQPCRHCGGSGKAPAVREEQIDLL